MFPSVIHCSSTIWKHCGEKFKSQPASEEKDSVYLAGLKGQCVLQAPSTKLDIEFRQVLFPVRPINGNYWWKPSRFGQSTGFQFHEDNTKPHISL